MKRIDFARLLEIGLFVVLVAGTGWLGRLMHHNYVTHGQAATIESMPQAPALIPARDESGGDASLQIAGQRSTLAFLLSVDCPFCEQNMPEWVQLAAAIEEMAGDAPGIVVLSLSEVEETEAFLATHGLAAEVRYVDRGILPLLGVPGYPTTLAIDPATRDLRGWSGVLERGDHEAIRAWAVSQTPGASAEIGAGGL